MARRRFFVDEIRSGSAELRGDEARHLTRVLRVEPGQRFEVSDNERAFLAEIAEARGEHVRFRILEPLASPPLPARVTLCAALIKFDRFEWIVEKATELGVERILPVEATRTERGLFEASRKRSERWQRIARESSQQSRRVRVPEILPAARFTEALGMEAPHRFFLEEAEAPALLHEIPEERQDTVALLLGPEGGWTDAERAAAHAAGWRAVSLGPLVLRAETAACAALAVVMAAWSA
ncbi:MAG: 16S rRNA (uracil(1498)-N(3))-methyltransferase [Acidobacteria bacterium]|nr:16S rRNA (uracil(1498)-N(3))-methyltransferase [Acidobacteriota bacterium]